MVGTRGATRTLNGCIVPRAVVWGSLIATCPRKMKLGPLSGMFGKDVMYHPPWNWRRNTWRCEPKAHNPKLVGL